MFKRKNILKIAIDSPAAAGAGTIAKQYQNIIDFYLDTGKIYRFIEYLKLKIPKRFNNKFIKSRIKFLKLKQLKIITCYLIKLVPKHLLYKKKI